MNILNLLAWSDPAQRRTGPSDPAHWSDPAHGDNRSKNYFNGQQVYRIPDEQDRFDLRIIPPFGQDRIVVYASEAPLGNVEMDPIGSGLREYRGSRESLDMLSRGIKVVESKENSAAGAEFYEAEWTIHTKSR
ncbi:MAG: DUF4384 domain-containing protein [Desulfosudaceae bacterium]